MEVVQGFLAEAAMHEAMMSNYKSGLSTGKRFSHVNETMVL